MAERNSNFQTFIRRGPLRSTIEEVMAQYGCEVIGVYPTTEPQGKYNEYWGFYIKPSSALKELLSIRGTFIIFVAETDEILEDQDRLIREVKRAIDPKHHESIELSDDFLLIVSSVPTTYQIAREIDNILEIPVIGFSTIEVRDIPTLNKRIKTKLYVRDLYTEFLPITKKTDFYGRQSFLKELIDHLVGKKTHVGLFGQRKMGKTSCIYRLADTFKQKNNKLVFCRIDLELIDSTIQSLEYLLWSIGESIFASLGRLKIHEFLMFGKYPIFSAITKKDDIPQLFQHDIQVLLRELPQHQFIIAFDEIELMSPTRKGKSWGDETGRTWRYLRGLAQQFPTKIVYLIAGTNPNILEEPRFADGHENPIYTFFQKIYLKPFGLEETQELLVNIGKKLGLGWDNEATLRVHELTGGHPLLVRRCGSVIHKHFLPRSDFRMITRDDVDETVSKMLDETDENLRVMIDVLETEYNEEFTLLNMLAKGQEREFHYYAKQHPEYVNHLNGYGMLTHSNARTRVKGELLQSWLQKRPGKIEKMVRPFGMRYQTNEIIGTHYRVISTIGEPGGLSEVYQSKDERNQTDVVVKVIVNGSFRRVLRETDILEKLQHPNIVKVLDKGIEDEKSPYLVMEYLEGNSLKYYCNVAQRLSPQNVHSLALTLLDVLKYIHPNPKKIKQLVTKSDLSFDDNQALDLARHGYLHRDIKPENVILVPGRGPVLIDFNISVRCGDPIRTVSATPGYLPFEGLPLGQWETDIDLYQLGLTLLQVGTGIEYDDDSHNWDDIFSNADDCLPSGLARFLKRLCAPDRQTRYDTAEQAWDDLRKISIN